MEEGNEEKRTRGGKKESGTTDISLDDSLILSLNERGHIMMRGS